MNVYEEGCQTAVCLAEKQNQSSVTGNKVISTRRFI